MALESGLDFVIVGRGGILHHDFPNRALADSDFVMADKMMSPAINKKRCKPDSRPKKLAFINPE